MVKLKFSDKRLEDSLGDYVARYKIDLIVTSRFIIRNPIYGNVRTLLSELPIPVHTITESLTLANVDTVLAQTPFRKVLVVGGGRLVDFFKLVCLRRQAELCVLLTNLSNDGFASGCSALPLEEGGGFVTIQSQKPTHIWAFQDLLHRMPQEFMISGLGEAISKLQVMEDLCFEYSKDEIARIFCQPLEALYDLLFVEYTIQHARDRSFVFRLATALHQFSSLMANDSTLCSRSEHEFEKACTINHVNLRHGVLVLIGAMVSMKVRKIHPFFQDRPSPIFTYDTLLKVIVKFNLTQPIQHSLMLLHETLKQQKFMDDLNDLSIMRPERLGLWNVVPSNQVDWKTLFLTLNQDLGAMKTNPKRSYQEVFEQG